MFPSTAKNKEIGLAAPILLEGSAVRQSNHRWQEISPWQVREKYLLQKNKTDSK